MTARSHRHRDSSGQFTHDAPIELVAQIRTVDGPEAQAVAERQARVLWEITQWQVQNASEPGQEKAA